MSSLANTDSLRDALSRGGHPLPDAAAEIIMCSMESGEYERAAMLANSAFTDGCVDVRCIVAMLIGYFIEYGPSQIPQILSVLEYVVGEGWAALEPESRKPQTVDGAIAQLLRNIKTVLSFHESCRDAVWTGWRTSVGDNLPAECTSAGKRLEVGLARMGTTNRAAVSLAALLTRISTSFEHAPPLDSPVERSDAPTAANSKVSEPSEQNPSQTSPDAHLREDAADPSVPSLEISPAMASFIQRLHAFALLLERGDVMRAAIVAHDVRRTIESFDPIRFLPGLLAPHFQLLSARIDAIAAAWEQEGTPLWQALVQHYRSDLKGFVEG